MKLRSVAVNQFKKFTTPTRLDGIEDGLNVVVGPNEIGKSTILDALRAVLFERHTSKARPITALQNDRNQAAPVVELVFELNQRLYSITKRFVKRPYARLSCPDGRILEGDSAEATLRSLLGFNESGNTGAKPETLGMWNILWVLQGESFARLNLPDSARSNLHSALESEVGAVLGGRRGRALPQTIENQLGKLITPKGRPRGSYKDLNDRIETLQDELEKLNVRRTELAETLTELENSENTLERLSSDSLNIQEQQSLNETRQRHGVLTDLEYRIESARYELEIRKQYLDKVSQELADRNQMMKEMAEIERSVEESGQQLEELNGQVNEAQSKLKMLRDRIHVSELAVTKADETVSLHRRIVTAVENQIRINLVKKRLNQAIASEDRLRKSQSAAAAIHVTDDAMAEINEADKELENIKGRLNVAATQISFVMKPDGLKGIEVEGKQLTADMPTLRAVEPITVSIPKRGRIEIVPGIKDRDQLLSLRLNAITKLKEKLDEAKAKSVNDAHEQHARRAKLLGDIELARREVELYAPADDDHPAGAQALSDYVEGLRQVLKREMDDLHLDSLPTLQNARNSLYTAEQQTEKTRSNLDTARAALIGPEENLNLLISTRDTLLGRRDENKKRLSDLKEQLDQLAGNCSDDELNSKIQDANNAVIDQQNVVSQLQSQRTNETLQQLEARISRLERAIKARSKKRTDLEIGVARLRSRVEVFGGVGLDEEIEEKNRDLERGEQELRRTRREVKVLDLLLSTLQNAEKEAMERYLSPVLNRVHPYLQLLFPGADLVIDENLQVKGVERIGGYVEDFHQLSIGTQEQVAVLVRLAFAQMLTEQGYPATVILDDALVFSDDSRMSRMFDILNIVANEVQIIILTCREQLFEELGGHQLKFTNTDVDNLETA